LKLDIQQASCSQSGDTGKRFRGGVVIRISPFLPFFMQLWGERPFLLHPVAPDSQALFLAASQKPSAAPAGGTVHSV
jgi:hypothetical protein